MADLILSTPAGANDVTTQLWTPTEITYVQSWLVEPAPGYKTGEGDRVFKHEFMLKFMGETEMFGVVAEESAPESQIEDIAAKTSERSMAKIRDRLQERGNKLIPEDLAKVEHERHRRDLAGAWREMLKYAKKRKASSSGRLYWPIA